MKKVQRLFIVATIIMSAFLVACSGGNGTNSSDEKQIFIGITNAPGSLNPINTTDVAARHLTSIMFESLVLLEEDLEFSFRLADEITTEDNQTFTAKLNEEVSWSDGEPFTAEDVLFTLETIGHPDVITSQTSWTTILDGFDSNGKITDDASDLEGVQVIDDHTVQFKTKTPVDMNLFLEQIGDKIKYLPKHVLEDVPPETLHQDKFMEELSVSTGAYTLVTYKKDEYVELEANENYYLGEPIVERFFFKVMPAANLVAQLQSGEIDMNVPGIGNISVQDFEKVKKIDDITVKSGEPTNYQMLFLNTETFEDVKVRQAIAHGIDREIIVENLLKGEGEVMDVPFTKLHPYYADINTYDYDPELAKELLSEANWDESNEVSILVPTGNQIREQAADIMAENLQKIGIKAVVQKHDMPTHVQKGQDKEFDIFMLGLTFELDPNSINSYFDSESNWNLSGYNNPKMDELLEAGRSEVEVEKRKEIYHDIQELILEDMPQLSLFADYRMLAVNNRVTYGEPKEIGMFNDLYKWDVE